MTNAAHGAQFLSPIEVTSERSARGRGLDVMKPCVHSRACPKAGRRERRPRPCMGLPRPARSQSGENSRTKMQNVPADSTAESARAILKSAATLTAKTVFLSHSSKDAELLPATVKILTDAGGRVYVDKGDDRLPQTPSPATAAILREAVGVCKRFVLLVSTNSKDSRWIPWELGLADGTTRPARVALFPVAGTSHEQSWANAEYLGLYKRIVWGRIGQETRDHWIVWDHIANTAQALGDWIAA